MTITDSVIDARIRHIRTGRSLMVCVILVMIATAVCISSCDRHDDNAGTHHNTLMVADSLYDAGDMNGSLAMLHRFVRDARSNPDAITPAELERAYYTLGNIHFAYWDYTTAREYHQRALDNALRTGNMSLQRRLAANMAVASCYLNRRDDAVRYNKMVREIDAGDSGRTIYFDRLIKGYIEMTFGSDSIAIPMMRGIIDYVNANKLDRGLLLSPTSELFTMYERHGRLDSALIYLDMYSALADKVKQSDLKRFYLEGYARLYIKLGDHDKAIHYQDAYISLVDSVMNMSHFHKIISDFHNEDKQTSDNKIRTLEHTVSKLNVWLVITLLIITLVGVLIFMQVKSREMILQLFKRNRELAVMGELLRKTETNTNPDTGNTTAEQQPSSDATESRTQLHRQLYDHIVSIMERDAPYCDPDFSLARLAELCGSNTKYVSQAINEFYHNNFRAFVNEYRIREARLRLTDTSYGLTTIQFVAESVGFMSTSAFNVAFKKFTGMTPSLYQRMARSEQNSSGNA